MLRHLCESEAVERAQRRTAGQMAESGRPDTKTLSSLDEALLPPKVRRQLPALIEGGFVERAVNVLAFALPGRGKTHVLAALGAGAHPAAFQVGAVSTRLQAGGATVGR